MTEMSVQQAEVNPSPVGVSEKTGKRKPLWLPIRLKITVPFLLLAIVLAFGGAFLITRVVFDSISERFTNQLIEAGKLASAQMVSDESNLLENLRFLANTEGLPEALKGANVDRLRELAYGIAVNKQLEDVEFLDTQGQLILSMRHRSGGNIEEYQFSQGGESPFVQWGFVQKVIAQRVDQLGDKFSGYGKAPWGDYFYVAGPVYDDQKGFNGVILVGLSLQKLAAHLREQTLTQISLYDTTGQELVTTFKQPVMLEPMQAAYVLEHQNEGSLQRSPDGQRDVSNSDINYVEILSAWEGRNKDDLGVLGVSLVRSFLVNASRTTRIQVTMLVAATFLIVILIGLNLASLITRPLIGLVQASRAVAKGDLQVQVNANTHDEIAVLASSFNQMVASLYRSKMDLVKAYDTTLEGWSMALEMRDKETRGHTQRVAEMTVGIARKMGLSEEEIVHVRRGAFLHDIGKMGIPDKILMKEGPLTDEEWKVMRKHPQYAYDMLKEIEYLRPALNIPLCHHEHWDGAGYPRGLKGEEIPLDARIFAVADVWDAVVSNRPYRAAWSKEKAFEYIKEESGLYFDPKIVDIFIQYIMTSEEFGGEQKM